MFKYFVNNHIYPELLKLSSKKYYSTFMSTVSWQNNINYRRQSEFLKYNLFFKYAKFSNSKHFSIFTNHDRQNIAKYYRNNQLCKTQVLYFSQRNANHVLHNEDKHLAKELEIIQLRYPAPTSLLHNFFAVVSKELEQPSYVVRPQYKMNDHKKTDFLRLSWTCTYSLKWPEEIKLQGIGSKKREASYRAAYRTILYLQKCGKMLDNGLPLVHNKSEIKKLRNANHVLHNEDKHLAKELEIIQLRYPAPTSLLHNFFAVVSKELEQPSYVVRPQYKMNDHKKTDFLRLSWTCTYSLKWPEEIKLQGIGSKKREASYRAAYRTILYLQKCGKMLDNGLPLVHNKSEIKKLVSESNSSLKLDELFVESLEKINKIFVKKLLPRIEECTIEKSYAFDDNDSANIPVDDILSNWSGNQRINNQRILEKYSAKEMVKLPIQNHRAEFDELLDNNRVIIVRGEPGCGKSTRIPQYVLEHWVKNMGSEPARIIVTQPRKVAAISLAERVAQERRERVGDVVGYQVRLKQAFNPKSGRILYCTTGILLRQIQADMNLRRCTHIILDEAHERDVNTDLVMNLLRHAININQKLKVIIMSATIDVKLFQDYFNNPPVINIPGFTHPVKQYFLDDINLNLNRSMEKWSSDKPSISYKDVARTIQWIDKNKREGAILCFLPGWEEIINVKQLLMHLLNPRTSVIVAIHSKLLHDEQKKIFKRPPPGVRKVILATNIAETSITVDDVVYVVDTGVHKETRFDSKTGVICIDNHKISQSSVNQRKGRAGRVQPGESYHLYPRKSYEDMFRFSLPEVLRTSLTKIVLDAKVYSHNMASLDFFKNLISPPHDSAVRKAVEELQDLEMLDENQNLTYLGRVVSDFQLHPKLSKSMILSVIYKCVIPLVDIATLFSSDPNIFTNTLTDKNDIRQTKKNICKDSDHIALMVLFEQWVNMMDNNELHEAAIYCTKYNLVPQKLNTLKQLRDIHFEYLAKYLRDAMELSNDFSTNQEFIKGVLLSGVGTVLLHRNWDFVRGRWKQKKVFITNNKQKATVTTESVNFKQDKYESQFLVYINETRSEIRYSTVIRETSVIQPLTYILFKNSELVFKEVQEKNNNADINDPIVMQLLGTNFRILCNREQALLIQNCKNGMKQMENYFVYQLTKGGKQDPDVDKYWFRILYLLNELLRVKILCK